MSTNVPPGYKQTEVGVIPEEWEVKAVGEIAKVKGGKRLPLGKSLVETPTSHPYIRVTDMHFGGVMLDEIKFVPDDVFPSIRNYRIWSSDIFISVAGTLGIVGKTPPVLDGANLTENADRITNILCDRDFLLYNLMSARIQSIIESEKTVGAQPKLALNRIQSFNIALPPIRVEQCAIAAALSDVDALLAKLDQLIAKKRDLKQATMQQLLTGQTRLPGFSGEWEVKRFDAVLSRLNVKVHQIQTSGYQLTGRYPVVDQGQEAVVGFSDDDDKLFCCPKEGVIVFGDHTCIVKFVDFDFLVGADGTQVLQGKYGQCTRFHALQLQHKGIVTTGYNRHFKFLKERAFLVPPFTEQSAIAAVLSDMDAEIAVLEARRDKTRALKQGMMQELLTGRIRLVQPADKAGVNSLLTASMP